MPKNKVPTTVKLEMLTTCLMWVAILVLGGISLYIGFVQ